MIVNANAAPPMVLVADDEPTMLELVTRHLRSIEPKLEVIEASDGDEAWRLARERLPDLVVLDVMMPGMSGWEVCRKIRQDAALAHTGVLMLTGIGESLNEATSPLFGADEFIDKPFDFEKLDEKIVSVLRRRAAQREAVPRPIAKTRSASPAGGNGVGGPAKAASKKPSKASRAKKKAKPATRHVTKLKQKTSAKVEKGKKTMAAKKAKKTAKKAKKTAKKAKKK
jgi:DNA-binding response OmpR family regulator